MKAIKKMEITKVLSCFFVLVILMTVLPIFVTQSNAVILVENHMGKVVGKDVKNNELTVQIEYKADYSTEQVSWVPYHSTSQWTVSNSDAIKEIGFGDYIEIAGYLGVGSEGDSICIGKMKSSTEKVITDVYGDPGYLVPVHAFIEHPGVLNPPLLGDYIITYENIPDCSKYPSGSFACNVEAKYSDVTISKGNEQLKSQRLYPGRSFKYEDNGRGYNIDITFNSGEAPAYPDCTDQPCLGPQAFSDFTIHIKKIEEKMPDLIIQDISWNPSSPKEGDIVTINIITKNKGSGNAGGFDVCYYADGSYYDKDYVSSLSAGSTTTTSFTWTAKCGNHAIKAVADCYNAVAESNEENNWMSKGGLNIPCKPDLIIEDIYWQPENPKQGDTMTFYVYIKNQGSGSAGTSTVKYYIDGSYVASDSVPAFSAGSAESTQTFTWKANKCGDVQVKAIADATNAVTESNEGNNERTKTVSVTCQNHPPTAHIDSITPNPAIFDPLNVEESEAISFRGHGTDPDGDSIIAYNWRSEGGTQLSTSSSFSISSTWFGGWPHTIYFKVKDSHNAWSNEVSKDFLIIYPILTEIEFKGKVLDAGKEPKLAGCLVRITEILEQKGEDIEINVGDEVIAVGLTESERYDTDIKTGDKIKVYGSLYNFPVTFQNLSADFLVDLISSSSFYLNKVVEEKKPDLIIQDISWDKGSPKQGDTITFTVKIKNRGDGNAGTSTVRYYIDGSDVDSDTMPSLSVGSTSTQTFTWTANKCRDVQVKAVADALGEIEESNEGNNQSTETVNVVCPKKQVHNINTGKDFSSIQAAINDSDTSPGNTITVDAGTYTENVDVTKSLTIKSTSGNPTDTIVQALDPNDYVFNVAMNNVKISGFTVKGATGWEKAGIILNAVTGCVIFNNDISDSDCGISLVGSNNNCFESNSISNNEEGFCLYGYDNPSNNNVFIDNNVLENKYRGVRLEHSSYNIFTKNTISGSGLGIWLYEWSNNNKIHLNNILNNEQNVDSSDSSNIWNSPVLINYKYKGNPYTNYLGNYWDDYKEKNPDAKEIDSSGIRDTAYSMDSDQDNYPLRERSENYVKQIKIINFSDHNWIVKSGYCRGPGPNHWSDSEENVWVDDEGLHLRITNRSGTWYCAEVVSEESFGYGRYTFYLDGRPDLFDENVVLGLFTYLDIDGDDKIEVGEGDGEIDIEFSEWAGEKFPCNTQYVLQPASECGCPCNLEDLYRFQMDLKDGDYSTHYFDWQSSSVHFKSIHGHYEDTDDPNLIINETALYGNKVPTPSNEKVHINLWLYDANKDGHGDSPSNDQEIEIIIKEFENYFGGEENKPPIADLTYLPLPPFVDQTITFDASNSIDPDGTIMSYDWNFGDGTTGAGKIITHSYEESKRYRVTLTVIDNGGAKSQFSIEIPVARIYKLPGGIEVNLLESEYTCNEVKDFYDYEHYTQIAEPLKYAEMFADLAKGDAIGALLALKDIAEMDKALKEKHDFAISRLKEMNMPVGMGYFCWSDYFALYPDQTTPGVAPYFGDFARETYEFIDGEMQTLIQDIDTSYLYRLGAEYVTIGIECPVNTTITDQYGRIISDTGTNEIPDADMHITKETKIFHLPADLAYSVDIDAYDTGTFNFTRVFPIGNNISITKFENIPVTSNTKASVEIEPGVTDYTMSIDYDGDGVTDEEKSPDVSELIEVEEPSVKPKGWLHSGYDLNNTRFYPYPSETSVTNFDVVWTSPNKGKILTGDINGDDELELISAFEERVCAMDKNGLLLWSNNVATDSGISGAKVNSMDLADMDGDNIPEVMVGISSAVPYPRVNKPLRILFYDGAGNTLKTISTPDSHVIDVKCADLNNDGKKEVIAAIQAWYTLKPRGVYVYDYNTGNELWHYNIGPQLWIDSIADINNDGNKEIIVGSFAPHNGNSDHGTDDSHSYAFAFDKDGNNLWTKQIGWDSVYSSVADLNNDGKPEIISFRNQNEPYYPGPNDVYILNPANGNIVDTYNGPSNKGWKGGAIADINGDGKKEIVIGNRDGTLRVLDYNLNLIDSRSLSGTVQAINDVNGDGKQEILVCTDDKRVAILDNELNEIWGYELGAKGNAIVSDLIPGGTNEIIVSSDKLYVFSGIGGEKKSNVRFKGIAYCYCCYGGNDGYGIEVTNILSDPDGKLAIANSVGAHWAEDTLAQINNISLGDVVEVCGSLKESPDITEGWKVVFLESLTHHLKLIRTGNPSKLDIEIASDKKIYASNDAVTIMITVTNTGNEPISIVDHYSQVSLIDPYGEIIGRGYLSIKGNFITLSKDDLATLTANLRIIEDAREGYYDVKVSLSNNKYVKTAKDLFFVTA